jgi:HSP20 family protein
VVETPDGLCIHVALPGVSASGVVVEIEQEAVVVSALRSFPECAHGEHVRRVEIPYGRFERRILLPMHALELTDRTMKDGVLTLNMKARARHERGGS